MSLFEGEDEDLDMCDPFGEAPGNPGDHPFHAGGLAKQRRRSIALPRGVITDGVLKDDEDAQAPAHQKSEGYSSLPFTYEATVEAGFDCERVGDAIKKECQDKAYIDEVFANQESQAVVAVLDGHGPHGKKASHDVCSYFMDSVANAKLDSARDIKAAMTAACLRAETVLELSPYDTRVSGTTLTAVLLRENELCVAWVGDSRAVLAVRQPNHRMKAVDISRDHKPDDRREKRRIESMGGEVKRFDIPDDDDDDDLPWRVFIRGTMIPGLAMSRSIGTRWRPAWEPSRSLTSARGSSPRMTASSLWRATASGRCSPARRRWNGRRGTSWRTARRMGAFRGTGATRRALQSRLRSRRRLSGAGW